MKTGNQSLHFIKFLLGLEQPNTQTTTEEQEAIKKYSTNVGSAVEIGVFEGFNTLNIARSINDSGHVYAIDPFIKGRIGICYGELISKKYIERYGVISKVLFIKKFSFDAKEMVPSNIEFIFIDGDHSYEGIKKDWNIWSKKVKVNGVIALHDTSIPQHNPSVKNLGSYKFYNETIKHDARFMNIETVDSMNILKRVS